MTQRYLQPQDDDILWNINATNITNINNHNMTMELSGNNGYVVNINNNRQLTIGDNYLHVPIGPSNERPLTVSNGAVRYNTTTELLEFYNGNWVGIDSPPVLTSIFPSTITQSNIDISLNGGNFKNNSTVFFIGQNNTKYTNNIVTYISSNLLIVTTPSPALPVNNGPYTITVNNPSGLSSSLLDILDVGTSPVFSTSAGSIGTIYNIDLDVYQNILLPVTATDAEGDDISYNISSGSLPPDLSLNQTTGAIFGNLNAVNSDTTFSFTVAAITANATSTRNFSISVKAPITQSFTFNDYSPQTFTIPSTLTKITAKLWGSGGGSYLSGNNVSGSGAAGGYSQSTFNILSGESYLTLIVAGKNAGQGYTIGGYGGGGEGRNGGSGGGGASMIVSGQISVPYDSTNSGPNNVKTSLTVLNGASDIILVAGGGGAAGWYVYDNMNGGPGGGIIGSSSSGGYAQNSGGTQSAGGPGNGNYDEAGKYLQGGTISNNTGGGGGSGGAGGGWYGGGVYQSSTGGNNSGGGGGSGFVGFTDGTSPNQGSTGTLLENYSASGIAGYTDSTIRTNGSRTYTNSATYRRTTAGARYPPQNSDSDYISGVGEGNQEANGTGLGGNGLIVLKY